MTNPSDGECRDFYPKFVALRVFLPSLNPNSCHHWTVICIRHLSDARSWYHVTIINHFLSYHYFNCHLVQQQQFWIMTLWREQQRTTTTVSELRMMLCCWSDHSYTAAVVRVGVLLVNTTSTSVMTKSFIVAAICCRSMSMAWS